MNAKVTIREVAKLAGVSLGTVSRVINEAASVRPATRLAVQQAMQQLGYVPNTSAQAMRTGATRTVGIIVRDLSVTTLAELAQTTQEVLEPAGYTVVIACSYDNYQRELELLATFAQRRVDGVIMTTCAENDTRLQETRDRLSIPIVYFDRVVENAAATVVLDHRSSTRTAVSYLLGMGHTRIALLTGQDMWPFRERLEGYTEAYQRHGLTVDPALIVQRSSLGSEGEALARSALALRPRPTAIIAGGFNLLPGTLRAIRDEKLEVPRDISLIAGADSELAQLVSPPTTAIRLLAENCGQLAATTLLHAMREPGGQPQGMRMVNTELILRESCAPPAKLD